MTPQRLQLRSFTPDDAPVVAPWLAEAVAAPGALKPDAATPTTLSALLEGVAARWPGSTVEALDIAGLGAAGFLVWHPTPPLTGGCQPATIITALATRRDARNLGYGSEAVYRLEEARPGTTMLAATPRFNGLSVYFWLRAGYRPISLVQNKGLARDPERFWLVNPATVSGNDGLAAR